MPNSHQQTRSAVTCIYCRRTGVPFDRDHVIPEAFGMFKHNFVLSCVCHDCNQYFGRHLELALARDTSESVLRLRYGINPAKKATELKHIRIKLTVHEPGPWMGAQAVLAADSTGNRLEVRPLPQVAFKDGKGDWIWVQENALTVESVAPHRTADMQVVAASAADQDRIVAKLQELGIRFLRKGDLASPVASDATVMTKLTSQIDEIIFRATGKIALNYAAYTQGAAFVLSSDFDDFRDWVRYGREPRFHPRVVAVQEPILFTDSRKWRQTRGHIVTLDWNQQGNGLLAQVSLFNTLTYRALLCPHYSGIWRNIRIGHLFDLETKTISQLGAVPLKRFWLPRHR